MKIQKYCNFGYPKYQNFLCKKGFPVKDKIIKNIIVIMMLKK